MLPIAGVALFSTSAIEPGFLPDYMPAGIIAVLILAFAAALVVVSVRRNDAE